MRRPPTPLGALGRHRRLSRHVTLTLIVLLVIALIGASPLALVLLDTKSVNWDHLSAIGQSYGAVSAILSAAAPDLRPAWGEPRRAI